MRGGRRFASCLFVTYHGFAAQGEHIGRAALQGSRPNIHLRNEWQINFFMRWWLWRKGLPPCRPLPSEKFCRAQGARKQNYNLRPPLPPRLPPRNALEKNVLSNIWDVDHGRKFYQGWGVPARGLYLRRPSSSSRCIAGQRFPRTISVIAWPGDQVSRVWHLVSRLLGMETFLNFLRVSVSVSKIWVSKKSLGIGLENI